MHDTRIASINYQGLTDRENYNILYTPIYLTVCMHAPCIHGPHAHKNNNSSYFLYCAVLTSESARLSIVPPPTRTFSSLFRPSRTAFLSKLIKLDSYKAGAWSILASFSFITVHVKSKVQNGLFRLLILKIFGCYIGNGHAKKNCYTLHVHASVMEPIN